MTSQFDPKAQKLIDSLPCPLHAEQAYDGNMKPHKIHLILGDDLTAGKLKRAQGDALCKPFKRFHRLQTITTSGITLKEICADCLKQAKRLQDYEVVEVIENPTFEIDWANFQQVTRARFEKELKFGGWHLTVPVASQGNQNERDDIWTTDSKEYTKIFAIRHESNQRNDSGRNKRKVTYWLATWLLDLDPIPGPRKARKTPKKQTKKADPPKPPRKPAKPPRKSKPKTPKPKVKRERKKPVRGLSATELEKKYGKELEKYKQKHDTAEQWYRQAVEYFRPKFEAAGAKIPPFDISSGFTAAGVRPTRVLGQNFYEQPDRGMQRSHIFLNPRATEPISLIGTVIHEVIHACCGPECGHKAPFKRIALAVGLTGPMRSTTWAPGASEEFAFQVAKMLGAFPNEKFMGLYKKQKTRLLKVHCKRDGYKMRVTSNWLKLAVPACPICKRQMTVDW